MTKRTIVTLALAALIALASTVLSTTSRAQDAQRTVNLSPGCNMTTLTFPDGTGASTLTTAVSPPGALQTVWRLDNATGSFEAYMPQAPQASDLTSLNLLDAVFICVDGSSSIAPPSISMPSVSPDPAGTTFSTNLASGCNAVGLSFPDGTTPSQVADAITPPGACESLWRYDAAQRSFQAYVAAAPQASDLTSLQFLDAVYVCTGEAAVVELPAVTAAAEAITAPPGDIRFVMEAAVPRVVDLPQSFVALEEQFDSYDPSAAQPGLLYSYDISYGDISALVEGPPQTLFYAEFALVLLDTAKHAQGLQNVIASLPADNLKAIWRSGLSQVGLELGSLTIQEVEPLATIGDEANLIRVRMQLRPAGTTEAFRPVATDLLTFRRGSVIGEVIAIWTEESPAQGSVTENLAKKLDAGIQEAMPQFLAAIP